jgi:hypothetical protein
VDSEKEDGPRYRRAQNGQKTVGVEARIVLLGWLRYLQSYN